MLRKILFPLLDDSDGKDLIFKNNIMSIESMEDASKLISIGEALNEAKWLDTKEANTRMEADDLLLFRTRVIRSIELIGLNLKDPLESASEKIAANFAISEEFQRYFFSPRKSGSNEYFMPLSIAEAANQGMWKFINYYVIPDVVYWRWGASTERYFSKRRNYSYNMWLRGYYLSKDPNYRKLNEDQISTIIERPNLLAYKNALPLLVKCILSLKNDRSLYRKFVSIFFAKAQVLDMLSLDGESLQQLIEECVELI